LLGGLVSYYAFSEPAWSIKTDVRANLRLSLFIGLGAAVAFVVARIRERLNGLNRDVAELSSLSHSQADLFREHATRVSDHLQLISALLQLKAEEEPKSDYSRVVMNAASRTMLISRMHRSFLNAEGERIDFAAFAQRLAHAALASRGHPPLIISIDGELDLLPEQATSLALALLECINARVAQKPRGVMRVALEQHHSEASLTVSEQNIGPEEMRKRSMTLLGAIMEQMRGRLVVGGAKNHAMLHLVFPRELQPIPNWDPLAPLH
jgi:two-component sensor histidine kinase